MESQTALKNLRKGQYQVVWFFFNIFLANKKANPTDSLLR